MQDIHNYIPETNHFLGVYYYYYYYYFVSCHRPFLPDTSLEPTAIPTAHSSSFRLQYFPCCVKFPLQLSYVLSLVNVFLVFLFKSFVTIPVAQITIGIPIHFMFHIRCISIRKLLF